MDKKCDVCEFLKAPKNQILTTKNWNVGIGNDQPYLGRAFATLRRHAGQVSKLNSDEWNEFQEIVGKLETAYSEAFGANVLNIECNMNHAFKTEPFNPHVHWHIYPRYKTTPWVAGIAFDDPLFGSHIDENLERLVSDQVVEEIIAKLKEHLK